MSEERAYSWDEGPIENPQESSFTILPPGDYPFRVVKFERGRHEPKESGKLPACPKAIIFCEIDGGTLGTTVIKNNLFLHSRCEGLTCQFFTAIGHRKHGEPLVMNWGQVTGSTGRCKVDQRKGRDGNVYNEIQRFLDPPAAGQATAQPAPQQQTIPVVPQQAPVQAQPPQPAPAPQTEVNWGDVPF